MQFNNIKDSVIRGTKKVISFGNDILQQSVNDIGSTFLGFALQTIAKKFTILAIAENSVTSRNITMRNNIPSNTVEKGVDMGERIKRQPFAINQTFTTSDFYIPKSKSTFASAIPDVIAKGLLTVSNSVFLTAVQNAVIVNTLKNIFNKKQLITLYTSIGIYENMAIEGLTIRHTPGNNLEFDMSLREIVIADNEANISDGNSQVIPNIVNDSNEELATLTGNAKIQNIKAIKDASFESFGGRSDFSLEPK